jgi:hypothetical protein
MVAFVLGLATEARAQLANNVTGLYYTGVNASGNLLAGGARDPNWTVTYSRVEDSNTAGNSYEGAAYVVSSTANSGGVNNFIDAAWVQNTTSAQWITAPGAVNSSGTANVGGVRLPGNGSVAPNVGIYTYQLAFNITGTGAPGTTVTNSISISLTVAADDNFRIFVNPSLDTGGQDINRVLDSNTPAFTGNSAWNNTTSATLTNSGAGANSVFRIGTNLLTVVVTNTNGVNNGSSGSTSLNPSGFLMYQVGSAILIDGVPIPEPGTFAGVWLAGVCLLFRRKRRSNA